MFNNEVGYIYTDQVKRGGNILMNVETGTHHHHNIHAFMVYHHHQCIYFVVSPLSPQHYA